MADIAPVYGVTNWGDMLSSLPSAMSNIRSQTVQQADTMANVPVQQAEAQNISAQATGQQLQNQKLGIMLDAYRHNMMQQQAPAINDSQAPLPDAISGLISQTGQTSNTSGVAPGATTAAVAAGSGEPAGTDGKLDPTKAIDPSAIATLAEKKYAVRDIWTPDEVQQLQNNKSNVMLGLPDQRPNILAMHKARIDSQTNSAQLAASDAYDQMVSLQNAPDGAALNQLARLKPNGPDGQTGRAAAEKVQALADKNGWTPEQTDQFVRDYAQQSANQLHRWSGRGIEAGPGGVMVDAQTKQPVPGAMLPQLTPNEMREGLQEANKLVPSTDSNGVTSQVPTWKMNGFPNARAYLNQWAAGRALGSAASARSTANAAVASGATPAPAPSGATPATNGTAPGAGISDPTLKSALADTSYRTPVGPTKQNAAPGPGDVKVLENAAANKQTLQEDGRELTQTGGRSLMFLTAAKQIMDGKNVPMGLLAPVQVALSQFMSAAHLSSGDRPHTTKRPRNISPT